MLTRQAYKVPRRKPQCGKCNVCVSGSLNRLLHVIQVFTAFWKQYQSTFSHFSLVVVGTHLLNVQCNSSYNILNRIQILSFFLSWTLIKNIPCVVNEFLTPLNYATCNTACCANLLLILTIEMLRVRIEATLMCYQSQEKEMNYTQTSPVSLS